MTCNGSGSTDCHLVRVEFGDGAHDHRKGPGPHTYDQAGGYTITLTVTNASGSDSASVLQDGGAMIGSLSLALIGALLVSALFVNTVLGVSRRRRNHTATTVQDTPVVVDRDRGTPTTRPAPCRR